MTSSLRGGGRKPVARSALPVYVEPAEDEALYSWLPRLASRLGLSAQALARTAFGIEFRPTASQWCYRPPPSDLKRISGRTGVGVARLRAMTLTQWSPIYRQDEAVERFCGARYFRRPPEPVPRHLAVCHICLETDNNPFLRLPWFIGWVAVCPHHEIRLTTWCSACTAKLRQRSLCKELQLKPSVCTDCGTSLLGAKPVRAHPMVLRFQAAMLDAKRRGAIDIEGIGRLSWPEFVAFADVLLGTLWIEPRLNEREQTFRSLYSEISWNPVTEGSPYGSRNGALALLAWFFQGWPYRPGPAKARQLLGRWLRAPRSRISRHLYRNRSDESDAGPHEIEETIRNRLRIVASTLPDPGLPKLNGFEPRPSVDADPRFRHRSSYKERQSRH